ncbi:MAG: DinB family protein [Candidatus Hodarchaeota archaeon]
MAITMEPINEYRIIWKKRYERIQNQRSRMWQELNNREINQEWLITRPKPSQWAIDEIIRHMLASEIRYIHQSFDPSVSQISEAVPAQWVGTKFFRLEESNHVSLDRLQELSVSIENETVKMLDSPNEAYEKVVKAPWGEEMMVFKLLEAFYDHDQYHRGQLYLLITFFRGLPRIIKSQIR